MIIGQDDGLKIDKDWVEEAKEKGDNHFDIIVCISIHYINGIWWEIWTSNNW